MDITFMPRGNGKTELLINQAHKYGCPIIVYNKQQSDAIKNRLKYKGWNDVEVYTINEWNRKPQIHHKKILVDELESFINDMINKYFNAEVSQITTSIEGLSNH